MLRPIDQLVGLVRDYRHHYDLTESEAHKAIRRDLREILNMSPDRRESALRFVADAKRQG